MAASNEDLAIVISASTDQLAGDLRRAAAMFQKFAHDVPSINAVKASSLDFAAIKKSARESGVAAGREFNKGFKQVKEAIALPTKAMMQGGTGVALADPFIIATAAAETFAGAVEAPFKAIAAGSHLASVVIATPFKVAGIAAEGLGDTVSGLVPVVGTSLGAFGKVAGQSLQLAGTVLGGFASGVGHAFGAAGEIAGKTLSGISKVAIQTVAVTFQHVKEAVNLAAELEQNRIGMEVLIGSAEKAHNVMIGLRKFAAETPFSNKTVSDAAKQLSGYGVAADQLLPTVKMLGDVSAGLNKPLNELVYLYGTLLNQDRAYTVDVKQFAAAGIQIYKELGHVLGISSDQVREFVEAGKVGVGDVQKAFIRLTSSGGQFFGLMERQSQSFAGLREQLSDSVEIARTNFGTAVIEELGLKQATRELTAWIGSVDDVVETHGRPALRFLREIGNGVGNVAGEFARAGRLLGGIAFDSVAKQFPNLRTDVQAIIADLQSFKLSPDRVINFAFDAAEGMVQAFGGVAGWMDNYATKFDAKIIKPVDYLIDRVKTFANFWGHFADSLYDMQDSVTPGNGNYNAGVERIFGPSKFDQVIAPKKTNSPFPDRDFDKGYRDAVMAHPSKEYAQREFGLLTFNALNNKDRFGPAKEGESAASVSQRYRELDVYLGMARHLVNDRGLEAHRPNLYALAKLQRENFLEPFTDNVARDGAALSTKYWAGEVPTRAGATPAAAGPVTAAIDPFREQLMAGLKSGRAEALSAASARVDADNSARLAALETAASSRNVREAFYGLAGAALDAKVALAQAVIPKWSPGAEIMDVAKRAREEHGIAPMEKIAKEFSDLQTSLAIGTASKLFPAMANLGGGIDFGTYSRATVGLAERAESITGPYRMPDAAMKDSVESVRLLNQWQTGRGQQTAESLLQQLVDLAKQQLNVQQKTNDQLPNIAPMPTPLGQS